MLYIETNSLDPCFNLAFEEYILKHRTHGDWLILWQNKNTVVVGLNQNPREETDPDFLRTHGITVVRRMTGGGAVYHDLGNLNYSFITDVDRDASLSRFALPVCRALHTMGIPAELTGRNDITVQGRKVSGVAQRMEGGRLLHHGTLLFDSDPDMVTGALRADPLKFESKSTKSVRARIGNLREFLPAPMTLSRFWSCLLAELTCSGLERQSLSEEELAQVEELAQSKYRSWDWTWGRTPPYTQRCRRRWPAGTLDILMQVRAGGIEHLVFQGDFLAVTDCTPLEDALRGVPCRPAEVAATLDRYDIPLMFGGITAEQIVKTIFE